MSAGACRYPVEPMVCCMLLSGSPLTQVKEIQFLRITWFEILDHTTGDITEQLKECIHGLVRFVRGGEQLRRPATLRQGLNETSPDTTASLRLGNIEHGHEPAFIERTNPTISNASFRDPDESACSAGRNQGAVCWQQAPWWRPWRVLKRLDVAGYAFAALPCRRIRPEP